MTVRLEVGIAPETRALCDLREAVGWDRAERDYPRAFDAYATCACAYTSTHELVGWCAALSDGVRHGFVLDAIVHPRWRRCGIGSSLVAQVVDDLRRQGVSTVHVDFAPENRGFYERCGFRASEAGILRIASRLHGDVPEASQ